MLRFAQRKEGAAAKHIKNHSDNRRYDALSHIILLRALTESAIILKIRQQYKDIPVQPSQRTNPTNPCAMRKEHLLPDKRLTPAAQPSEEDALSIKYKRKIAQYIVLVNRNLADVGKDMDSVVKMKSWNRVIAVRQFPAPARQIQVLRRILPRLSQAHHKAF